MFIKNIGVNAIYGKPASWFTNAPCIQSKKSHAGIRYRDYFSTYKSMFSHKIFKEPYMSWDCCVPCTHIVPAGVGLVLVSLIAYVTLSLALLSSEKFQRLEVQSTFTSVARQYDSGATIKDVEVYRECILYCESQKSQVLPLLRGSLW